MYENSTLQLNVKSICFILLVAVLALGSGLAVCAQRGPQEDPERTIRGGISQSRDRAATAMRQAATRAGVSIDTNKMVITTRDDSEVILAPISGKDTFLFAYFNFRTAACAERLPTGFYNIKATTDPSTGQPQAQVIDSRGRTVLVAPMERQERKATPEERNKTQVGIQVRHVPEEGVAVSRSTYGTCRCEFIDNESGYERWRRLHTVIIV